jgi:hypothetical protein
VRSMKTWMAGLCVVVAACSAENARDTELGSDEAGASGGDGQQNVDGGVGSDGGSGNNGNGNGNGTGNVPGPGCSKFTVQAERAVPDMLIVLDRSGSMAPNGNDTGTDRWSGSVEAVTDVVEVFDDRVSFGLMMFPKPGQGSGRVAQCTAGAVDVQIGATRGDRIAQTLADADPGGNTPTASTLEAALPVISKGIGAVDAVVPPKYVLLVTDGDPNCSPSWPGNREADPVARTQTIAAIEKLTKAGVKTFVVGYQTKASSFAQQLDKMAAAGGTGDKAHRSVESGADLAAAFEQITSRAVSCSYQLEQPVADPSFVLVTVGSKSRAFGNSADGWTLAPDKQTVTLEGAACDELQKGAALTVEVVCEEVEVI